MIRNARILTIALSVLFSGTSLFAQTMKFATNRIVAHRGAWKAQNLPENSLAALKQAIKLGCEGSEFDVHRTADDSIVINHDPIYAGMDIARSTFNQLNQQKLANGESLPTLRQFLETGIQQKSTKLFLEIKPSSISKSHGQETAARIAALVKELKAEPWIVYISFDYDILKKIRSLDSSANLQYLNGDIPPARLKSDKINGADYNFYLFRDKPKWIEAARQLGIDLNVWTVNEKSDIEFFCGRGFRYITTNEPELALDCCRRPEEKQAPER